MNDCHKLRLEKLKRGDLWLRWQEPKMTQLKVNFDQAVKDVENPFAVVETNPTPLFRTNMVNLANESGSALPYIFAWFLGVPTSILFLVFMLKAIF